MKELWISSSMTTGSMRSATAMIYPAAFGAGGRELSIDEGVLSVLLDELPAGLHILPHQDGEHPVGRRGVLEGHLAQDPGVRVHGGLPQLLGIHLTETL